MTDTVIAQRILGGKLGTLRTSPNGEYIISRSANHVVGNNKNLSSTMGKTLFHNYYNGSSMIENIKNNELGHSTTVTEFSLGCQDLFGGGNRFYDGHIEEIIIYNSDQTDNRLQIESNINNYYGLFKYNDEALIYKFINDIGYYYENTLPDYLVSNWNFKPEKTQTASDYNPAITRESAKSIELVVENNVLGAWEYYDDQPFPLNENGIGIRSQYRLFSINNWDIRKETTPKFSYNDSGNGYYYAKKDGASISFKFNPQDNIAKQVNFDLQTGDTGYLEVFINGAYVAHVYSNAYFYLEKGDLEVWSIQNTLPLVLMPGDIVTFESVKYSWNYPTENATLGSAIKPSSASAHEINTPENGVGYTLTYPNLGDSKTVGDILATATQEELPTRILLRSLINTLGLISFDANIIIPTSFTNANYDILIKYEDAMLIKSLLELYDTFLSIASQYYLEIPLDYNVLSNLGPYDTAKAFFNDYPQILETLPERLSDQSDTKSHILSSLAKLEEILPLLFNRGSLDAIDSSYMFTVSADNETEDLINLLSQISAFKDSLNGFVETSAFSERNNGGYKISLAPFVSETPFPIRGLIDEIESDVNLNYALYDDNWEDDLARMKSYDLLKKYGFTSDLLPISMRNKILIFKDYNGDIISSIFAEDVNYSPYSGELSSRNSSILGIDNYENPIQLSYLSESKGTWLIQNYNYDFNIVEGSFTWNEAKLDAESRNGRLAILNTEQKINSANQYLNSVGEWPVLWIGASDAVNEGQWKWLTGESVVSPPWGDNEPGGSMEDYMAIWHSGANLSQPLSWSDWGNEIASSIGGTTGAYLLEIPYDNNFITESGEFYYYDGSLDLNDNGVADGLEIEVNSENESSDIDSYILYYPNTLNESLIQTAETVRINSVPNSLRGMIFVTKRIYNNHNDENDFHHEEDHSHSDTFWPYEARYYISDYDYLEVEGENYDYSKASAQWVEYYYNNGKILN